MKVKVHLVVPCIISLLVCGCAKSQENVTQNEGIKQQNNTSDLNMATDYDEDLPRDYKGTLSMWGWDDIYFDTITKAFQEKYPNVKFEYTPVENGDLQQKYETALITGGELPDIGWAILAYRANIFELDMWEALNQEPYNFDISEVYECTQPLLSNSRGEVCGIEQNLSVAGMAYRKDLAMQYLGTDDPKTLECMLPDWDTFIEKGKEVYEKSNGQVYMWPGLADAQYFIREQNQTPWIEGNIINLSQAMKRSLELTCQFRDSHTADILEAWTPEWYEALGKGEHIFTGCATWSIAFEIEQYDPEGKKEGHWGLMSAPEGDILWGGTTLGITKTCKDKRLAWEFIKFATLSTEGAEALNSIGVLTSAKKPYQENPELCSFKSEWFGDQDVGAYFLNEILPNVRGKRMTVNDYMIHESLNLLNTALREDPSITADEAMEFLKKDLEEKLPEYEIR